MRVMAAAYFCLGEMLGFGIGLVTGALGFLAKNAADDPDSGEDPSAQ